MLLAAFVPGRFCEGRFEDGRGAALRLVRGYFLWEVPPGRGTRAAAGARVAREEDGSGLARAAAVRRLG